MIGLNPPSLDTSLPDVRLHTAEKSFAAADTSRADKSFASELTAASSEVKSEDAAREAADQLVATAFILPLLEEARNDPFKSELFHGGRGEEVFGQQLDVIFADNITKSANFGLSDALVRRFQNPISTPHEVNRLG